MHNLKIIWIVLLVSSIKITSCCNGFHLNVSNVQNCDKPGLSRIKGNFTATLEENCDIVIRGCAKLSDKPIKRFMVRYAINKPTFVGTRGMVDVCKMTRKVNSPMRCPIPPRKICLNGELKVNMANYRSLLGLAKGVVKLEMNGELDNGRLCIEIEGMIEKKQALLIS